MNQSSASVTARGVAAWVGVAVGLIALGGLLAWAALGRPLSSTPDRPEIVALQTRLAEVRSAIAPIAVSFTSETSETATDIASYRMRIGVVRDLVDSTNGLAASSPEAVEVRDLIVTGGSQVLDGLDDALDALESDDESATITPDALVGDGIAALQDASDKIDQLLGRS